MALQSRPDAVVCCAHCALTGQLAQFPVVAVSDRVASARRLPTQRRVPKHLAPEHDYALPIEPAPPPQAMQQSAPWHPPAAPHAAPPPAMQQPPVQTMPGHVAGFSHPFASPAPPEPPPVPPAPAPVFQFADPALPRMPEIPPMPELDSAQAPAPMWPGLGKIEGDDLLGPLAAPPAQMAVQAPAALLPPQATPSPAAHAATTTPGGLSKTARTSSVMGMQPMAPKEKTKGSSWLAKAALFILMSASAALTGLLVKEQLHLQREAQKTLPPPPLPVEPPPPALKAAPSKKEGFVANRVARANTAAALEGLLQKLFNAATTDERLACVSPEREAREEIDALFPPDGPPLVLRSMKELAVQPMLLPEDERVPVFAVITSANPSGALARLTTTDDGRDVILWPLFHETHQRVLTGFIEKRSREPGWFHVGFRRVHGFDLPEDEKDAYHAIDVDGSTDGSGHIVTYVSKTTPAGRFLDAQMEWGTLYLGQLLLGWMKTGDFEHITILDCRGANIEGRELPPEETIAPAVPATAPPPPQAQPLDNNSQ